MPLKEEKGLTLVEVLAGIVILSIILLSVGSFFINGTKYSNASEQKLSNAYIANNILNEYKQLSFKELHNCLGEDHLVDIKAILNIPSEEQPALNGLEASLTISEHSLKNRVVILSVEIENRNSDINDHYEMKRYVKSEGAVSPSEGGACSI
ncbi:hypothetical protein GCM10008986_26800 [Salinibacillus aidingensis]|uniref:Prepilin-type N-terminal cleavage/methylation domain-containing protein n=1 Tax=Salinibacillus aidingensis TaxID=237684 RepID=A0ABN1BIQ2_9BACI